MKSASWFALTGVLLIVMTVISASLKRLPLTASILYLLLGTLLGSAGFGVIALDPLTDASLFRLLTEVAVVISLFTAGLKLRVPLVGPEWKIPILLSTASMLITILVVSAVGFFGLGLPLGGALLLGSILAPTDPVLASSVQVLGPADRDRLRFSLTAEAGLNDGTAFPFVMLGLGLLGLRDIGSWGQHWFFIDLCWGVLGGLGIGTLLATVVGRLVGYLRRKHEESESFDDFLALGLIGLSYGVTVLLHAYGFLAVFAAGLALRRGERQETRRLQPMADVEEVTPRTDTISGHMALAVLQFNEQIERIGELVIVILLGSVISLSYFSLDAFWIVLALLLVARPLSVFLGTPVRERSHKMMLAWFGIRGIGSLYYLFFAIEQGLSRDLAQTLTGIVASVVVASIFIHGLSSTPLMIHHEKWQ